MPQLLNEQMRLESVAKKCQWQCQVANGLQSLELIICNAVQHGVAVIKTRADKKSGRASWLGM